MAKINKACNQQHKHAIQICINWKDEILHVLVTLSKIVMEGSARLYFGSSSWDFQSLTTTRGFAACLFIKSMLQIIRNFIKYIQKTAIKIANPNITKWK